MIVVSIGGIANDETNYDMWLELPYSQPSMRLEPTRREGGDPVITRARREPFGMDLNIKIMASTEAQLRTLRETLLTALDTETAAIALIVEDDDGSNERYRYVMVRGVDEHKPAQGTGAHLVATLVVHGETRWRSTTPSTTTWNITATGQTTVIANDGTLPARPTYTIQPTSANTTKFAYRRFCLVKWQGRAATNYPVDITQLTFDTAALITAGKLSGENNLAVSVDGVLRKRWITKYNTANTDVWVNLDFIWCPLVSLKVGFGAGDTITEIQALEPINLFPFQGTLEIDFELFTYTGKREEDNTFTGVTRAVKESTADLHIGTDEDEEHAEQINLVQHDIWILYGGGGSFTNTDDTSGPTVESGMGEDTLKPVIDLDRSTNLTWYFEHFGQSGPEYRYRPMSWRPVYSRLSTTEGEPWDVIGMGASSRPTQQQSWWYIPTAHKLAAARIVGYVIFSTVGATWEVGLRTATADGIVIEYITVPSTASINPLTFDLSVTQANWWSDTVRFYLRSEYSVTAKLDVATLTWTDGPVAYAMPEHSIYDLDLLLENVTTGQSITLAGQMELNQQLEVDTTEHRVTLLDDATTQYQMLTRSTRRREILPLQPGNNTLRATETGLAGMTIYIEFDERNYS